MRKLLIARNLSTLCKPLAVVALCAPLLAMAQAGGLSFSGPSIVPLSKGAMFTGRGLSPNSAVSISIVAPGGAEATFSAVVAADGSLSYSLQPVAIGMHALKLMDSSGKVLSTLNFQAAP